MIAVLETFLVFLHLGVTAFGGPVAHLGYFRAECVERRQWVDEAAYADIVALCQFLPGPASSQVAMILGLARAGWPGAAAAWIAFTAPSAALLYLFALGVSSLGAGHMSALHGLKIVAVAVVAQAVSIMARSLCPDRERATLAVLAAVFVLLFPMTLCQLAAIAAGAVLGWLLLPGAATAEHAALPSFRIPRPLAVASLGLFVALLLGLPVVAADHGTRLFSIFFRSGALVFGGGHVVLPLLQQAVVPRGFITNDAFLAGYGAAQAVPGPLFTFAAYLGAAMWPDPSGLLGATLCLFAIYLPSFLLLIGVLPFWEELRKRASAQAALKGVNAVVVGLLLAALYTPVWTSAIATSLDFALALLAFLLLVFWKTPPWAVVVLGAVAGAVVA
jgi:chromate transporter